MTLRIAARPEANVSALPTRREIAASRRSQIHEWMKALAAGDRTAFDPLFEALWPIVREVTGRMLANPADADDAAQDALLRLASRVGQFDPARDAVAWVIGIAVFECRTSRRRTARRREAPLDVGEGHHPIATELSSEDDREWLAKDLSLALARVLETLEPADVDVIRAALREDRVAGDGTNGAAFRKRLQRAVTRLRTAWRALHGDE